VIRRPRMIRTRAVAYIAGGIAVLAFAMMAVAASAALMATITSGPSGTTADTTAVFEFSASVRDASFTCSLDGAPATACTSPRTYRALAVGRHVFVVTATSGRESARASRSWTVSSPTPPPPPPPPPLPPPPLPPTLPCGQSLGQTKICFDDLPPGTVVGTQYSSLDVVFGVTPTGPNTVVKPFIEANPQAHSDGQILKVDGCGGEFCNDTIHGRFWHAHKYVRVWAGAGTVTKLTAYDGSGYSIGSVTKLAGSAVATALQVSSSTGQIVYFTVSEDAADWYQYADLALDDLTFDTPDANAKPDFGMTWQPTWANSALAVDKGGSTSTTIFVTRLNGSTGKIGLSLGSAPPGITATFSPNPFTEATSHVTMTVHAAANTADLQPPAALTVVGHPIDASAGSTDHSLTIPLLVLLSNYDVRVKGIEVTQGIQDTTGSYYIGSSMSKSQCATPPSLLWAPPGTPISYQTEVDKYVQLLPFGNPEHMTLPAYVRLVKKRKTVVRVFAGVASPVNGTVSNVPALLYGYHGGDPLPGSPLSPDDGTHTLKYSDSPFTTCLDRADPNGAYTFTLPSAWAKGIIKLRAKLEPDTDIYAAGYECGSTACAANNEMTLTNVEFEHVPSFTLTPVEMSYHSVGDVLVEPPTPKKVFSEAVYLIPTKIHYAGGGDNYNYAGFLSLTDEVANSDLTGQERCDAALDKLEEWTENHPHGNETVGVFAQYQNVCGSSLSGESDPSYHLPEDHVAYSVVAGESPRTAEHEMTHGIGRPHSGSDPACYGSTPNQIGEWWFPDQRGQIHGIGLDTRAGSGGASAPYRVIVPSAVLPAGPLQNGQGAEWVDYMSYCTKFAPYWISTQGWNDEIQDLQVFGGGSAPELLRGAKAGAAAAPSLRVAATVSSAGVHVLSIDGNGDHPLHGGASDYRLVSRSANGAVVADTAMRATSPHAHDTAAHLLLRGVASAAALRIEIVRNGAVLARRIRSGHAPQVALVAPVAGARVAGPAALRISWKATDADGDKLDATLDYSVDDGAHWETTFMGANENGVRLPVSAFPPSSRARLRVTINDGFNETNVLSGRFVVVARPPSVRIISPARGQRLRADATVYLEGDAYDDRGSAIGSGRLQWFLDRRPIARGEEASAFQLPPGRHLVRLAARDARGRVGSASLPIHVLAVAPHLLDLRAPAFVARRATRLTFAVATTIPATLAAEGRRYAVGRTLRRIQLSIRPGRAILHVPLRLVAGRKVTRSLLIVPRR
jgi:hypothetical protein